MGCFQNHSSKKNLRFHCKSSKQYVFFYNVLENPDLIRHICLFITNQDSAELAVTCLQRIQ